VLPDAAALPVAMALLQQMRALGVSVQMHSPVNAGEGMGSMKSQFKKADASGARYALVFGADELARGCVLVKSLRDGAGQQEEQALADVTQWAATLQSNG
jgi:histidyl-tRNA synthetase